MKQERCRSCQQDRLAYTILPVRAEITGYFTSPHGEADQRCIVKVESVDQTVKIARKGVVVVALPGVRGTPSHVGRPVTTLYPASASTRTCCSHIRPDNGRPCTRTTGLQTHDRLVKLDRHPPFASDCQARHRISTHREGRWG